MFAKIKSAGFFGIQGFLVEAEADASSGIPQFHLTGALATETREAQYRVWNAIKNSGIQLKPQKITVNLSPASVRKEGTGYDLAIAIALLCAAGELPSGMLSACAFLGELGLDGAIKPVRGMLPLALTVRDAGLKALVVPAENVREASLLKELKVIGAADIGSLFHTLRSLAFAGEKYGDLWLAAAKELNGRVVSEKPGAVSQAHTQSNMPDFSEVRGQAYLRRAAEIAASGRHNLLLSGPAGTGKTMIARRMAGILPPLLPEEKLEISKLYSVSGLLSDVCPLLETRPFRTPHHSITAAAFTGGGQSVMPGELSLASGGILFLDELPLFSRTVLESLREPMEEQKITVTRLRGSCTYPADFQLVAAQNNCPCGYFPDRARCKCTRSEIRAYLGRLSRPVIERIDICAEAMPLSFEELSGAAYAAADREEGSVLLARMRPRPGVGRTAERNQNCQKMQVRTAAFAAQAEAHSEMPAEQRTENAAKKAEHEAGKLLLEPAQRTAHSRPVSWTAGREDPESSATIRQRVIRVHEIQKERFQSVPGILYNSRMGLKELSRFCVLGREEQSFLREVFQKKQLSGRTYHKILKVARTIADMENEERIRTEHLIEAVSFRSIEERLFELR